MLSLFMISVNSTENAEITMFLKATDWNGEKLVSSMNRD